jgi:hypothetical protein
MASSVGVPDSAMLIQSVSALLASQPGAGSSFAKRTE